MIRTVELGKYTEIADFYAPGDHACTFEVDGFRFGCLVCIEVNFPELWMEQQTLGVDCVLFSTFSEDPIFEVIACAHAAVNGVLGQHRGARAMRAGHGLSARRPTRLCAAVCPFEWP